MAEKRIILDLSEKTVEEVNDMRKEICAMMARRYPGEYSVKDTIGVMGPGFRMGTTTEDQPVEDVIGAEEPPATDVPPIPPEVEELLGDLVEMMTGPKIEMGLRLASRVTEVKGLTVSVDTMKDYLARRIMGKWGK